MMPQKSGWQALRELKADPDLRDIPVAIISVVADESHGKALGAFDQYLETVPAASAVSAANDVRADPSGLAVAVLRKGEGLATDLGALLQAHRSRIAPAA